MKPLYMTDFAPIKCFGFGGGGTPTATATRAGKIKIGTGFSVDQTGILSFDTSFKNLFNSASGVLNSGYCENGTLLQFVDGLGTSSATYMASGYVAVSPGKTYIISSSIQYTDTRLFCYGANHNYLGLDHAISSYPVAEGVTVEPRFMDGSLFCVRFTLSPSSPVRYIRFQITATPITHDLNFFDTRRTAIQVEEGTTATSFTPYGANNALKTLAPSYVNMGIDVSILQSKASTAESNISNLQTSIASIPLSPVKLIKSGDALYIRTTWTEALDLVQKLNLHTANTDFDNNEVEFEGYYSTPISTLDSGISSALTVLKYSGDDIAPIKINNTYIGANHGAFFVQSITATGHGKTAEDCGSEWLDGSSNKWYIIRIVDVDTLWVLPENTGTSDVWTFLTSLVGTTLTHSANATHTGTITFSSPVLTQLKPAVKNHTKTVLLNGVTPVTTDGIYTANYIDVRHSYDISNVPDLLAFVIANVGSTTAPAFDDSTIANVARIQLTYRHTNNGAVTVYSTINAVKAATLGYAGFIQGEAITPPSGGTLHQYIPRLNSFVLNTHTYDFTNIQDITNILDSADLLSSNFSDANKPPDRFIQFSKDSSSNKVFGFTLGYNPNVGIGKPATRKDNINSAGFIHTTKKQYPRGITGSSTNIVSTMPAGAVYDMVAFRAPINYTTYPNFTNVSWYYIGNDCYFMFDIHNNYSGYITLPVELVGKQIENVDVHANVTINSAVTTNDGIAITVTSNYGYGVLRLY